ncbi:SEC-C metal-binding domain-containing protein [Halobacillus sp. BBL2006]|uniref:SEC-C metal-binding domain-containing protein n=1 Tax=Halobacillus sp. BBL2006 TaxID=1543706 RepID=UPI00054311FE|nr:SEC-C metal-binding domain-containing protein [Halobacillus sp. BBL2006]KHE67446.1 hypothetical protein LD39_17505 [Halobacillus sp. BBL2006]
MSKVKRNGPCPCGSGDKYKKCCGRLSGEEVTPERVHEALNEQYANFMDYVAEFYTDAAPSGKAKTKEKQMEEAFRMMNEVFLVRNKEQTVFEEYLEEKGLDSIPHPAKASVKEWTTLKPGLYEIRTIDSEQTAKVKDVFTSIAYDVKRDGIPLKDENVPNNPYVMGILMKWGWESNFIPLAIPNQPSFYEAFRELLEQGQDSSPKKALEQNFMSYMKKWIHSDLNEGQDSEQVSSQGKQQVNVEEDDVLQLLGENIAESIHQSSSYQDLQQLWSRYKNTNAPKYRKPSVFSAALEFLVTGTEYFDHSDKTVTKKAVASKYGVSPSSMTRRLDELKDFAEEQ